MREAGCEGGWTSGRLAVREAECEGGWTSGRPDMREAECEGGWTSERLAVRERGCDIGLLYSCIIKISYNICARKEETFLQTFLPF